MFPEGCSLMLTLLEEAELVEISELRTRRCLISGRAAAAEVRRAASLFPVDGEAGPPLSSEASNCVNLLAYSTLLSGGSQAVTLRHFEASSLGAGEGLRSRSFQEQQYLEWRHDALVRPWTRELPGANDFPISSG